LPISVGASARRQVITFFIVLLNCIGMAGAEQTCSLKLQIIIELHLMKAINRSSRKGKVPSEMSESAVLEYCSILIDTMMYGAIIEILIAFDGMEM